MNSLEINSLYFFVCLKNELVHFFFEFSAWKIYKEYYETHILILRMWQTIKVLISSLSKFIIIDREDEQYQEVMISSWRSDDDLIIIMSSFRLQYHDYIYVECLHIPWIGDLTFKKINFTSLRSPSSYDVKHFYFL